MFRHGLPFDDKTFDAVFSNDVLCHIPGRPKVLGEMFRVLKPGGRMLFSDALVVGGMLSHEEIATRSSIGFYVYSPPGENERLIEARGISPDRRNRHHRECCPDREAVASGPGKKKTGTDGSRGRNQFRGAAAIPVLRAFVDQRTAPAQVFVLRNERRVRRG